MAKEVQRQATYFPCLHILKLQQVYINLWIQTFPITGKVEICPLWSMFRAQPSCLLSALLPSLSRPGTHQCGSCDRTVQPPVWSCSTQAPAALRVPILSPQTSPKWPTSGLREHAEDQSQHFKQSQTYPTLPSNHWALRGTLKLGHSCHTAALELSRTSLKSCSHQPWSWDGSHAQFEMLCCFGCSWAPQGCSSLKWALKQVPQNSRNQQIFLRSVNSGI